MKNDSIRGFNGEYRFLSNFWLADFEYEGKIWPSVEHCYQAHKTKCFDAREKIRSLKTPSEAKRKGRKLKVREDWDSIKLDLMEEIVTQKFVQNESLFAKLMQTKPMQIIEENYWGDTYWGVCKGKGENHLGKILMKIRDTPRNAAVF